MWSLVSRTGRDCFWPGYPTGGGFGCLPFFKLWGVLGKAPEEGRVPGSPHTLFFGNLCNRGKAITCRVYAGSAVSGCAGLHPKKTKFSFTAFFAAYSEKRTAFSLSPTPAPRLGMGGQGGGGARGRAQDLDLSAETDMSLSARQSTHLHPQHWAKHSTGDRPSHRTLPPPPSFKLQGKGKGKCCEANRRRQLQTAIHCRRPPIRPWTVPSPRFAQPPPHPERVGHLHHAAAWGGRWHTTRTTRGGVEHLGLTHTETQRGMWWTT